eukprot:1159702-Pelagomonas_calceolata.AAC.3
MVRPCANSIVTVPTPFFHFFALCAGSLHPVKSEKISHRKEGPRVEVARALHTALPGVYNDDGTGVCVYVGVRALCEHSLKDTLHCLMSTMMSQVCLPECICALAHEHACKD